MQQLSQAIQQLTARQEESENHVSNAINNVLGQIAALAPPPLSSRSPSPPPRPLLSATKAKVATPSEFDGDRSRGRAFINSCTVYFRLCQNHFSDDQERILWALSYMKSGRAAKWADSIFRWEEQNPNHARFLDWQDFVEAFKTHFYPVDAEASAVNILESTAYYQRSRSVDDYLDEFRTLISDSGYTDAKVIVVKFRRGLQSAIQNAIATMVSGRPTDTDFEGWYAAARRIDQAKAANDAFQTSGRADPPSRPKPVFTPTPRPAAPIIIPPPAPKPSDSGPVPMDIDLSRKSALLPPTCYRCGKAGHVKADCPKRFDVRHMTMAEKEELIQSLLAEKDASEAVARAEAEGETDEDFQ